MMIGDIDSSSCWWSSPQYHHGAGFFFLCRCSRLAVCCSLSIMMMMMMTMMMMPMEDPAVVVVMAFGSSTTTATTSATLFITRSSQQQQQQQQQRNQPTRTFGNKIRRRRRHHHHHYYYYDRRDDIFGSLPLSCFSSSWTDAEAAHRKIGIPAVWWATPRSGMFLSSSSSSSLNAHQEPQQDQYKNHRQQQQEPQPDEEASSSHDHRDDSQRHRHCRFRRRPPLIVLIPAYNEEGRIGPTLTSYYHYLSHHWNGPSHILVVNDGSTDDTVRVVQQQQQEQQEQQQGLEKQQQLASTGGTTTTTTIESYSQPDDQSHGNDHPTTTHECFHPTMECISLSRNSGKGAALAFGIQTIAARYQDKDNNKNNNNTLILTTDADGSAPPRGIEIMYQALVNYCCAQSLHGTDVYYDSEDNNNDETKENAPFPPVLVAGYRSYESSSSMRQVFRWGFRTVVQWILFLGSRRSDDHGGGGGGMAHVVPLPGNSSSSSQWPILRRGHQKRIDTQCGFKLYSSVSMAQALFTDLILTGWSHDVQIWMRAMTTSSVRIVVQPIEWIDQPGSKLEASPGGVVAVSLQMLYDVLLLKWMLLRSSSSHII